MQMSRLTWDMTAEPVSGGQVLRLERGERNIHFQCSADHEQDWQPYPVDISIFLCDCTYILRSVVYSSRSCCVFSGARWYAT